MNNELAFVCCCVWKRMKNRHTKQNRMGHCTVQGWSTLVYHYLIDFNRSTVLIKTTQDRLFQLKVYNTSSHDNNIHKTLNVYTNT